ncbi:peptide/nickel transport system permease protein [Microbacterium keratanolyticum]|uniref:ABC di/oligopeptide transporter inner membrane subunit n=1 Tax=Microbacterium keratanolyticum TaxID=67574 RepID=A0A9W6M7F1_9MICO|nr:ABC transporter permease [Microbacterium keratanolyticum]MBM7468857.1 peptide/nickel transport system permease protein [Microbacterium keratanolyticum]GLK00935.1 ABC di/oligopeptide transporter inner membrane subunit [Microbacterium keratanolyticum]
MAMMILRRLAAGIVLLFVVATVVFLAMQLVPGDPARLILTGTGATPTEEAVEQLREKLGLNLPLWQQYFHFLGDILSGTLGQSVQDGNTVASHIALRLPRTLQLVLTATVISVICGIALGAAAARRGGWVDRLTLAGTSFAVAVPSYVAAVILVYVVGVQLRWLPSGGYTPPDRDFGDFVQTLILPVIALSIGFTGIVARMTRSSVLGVLNQDWVRTGRAVGNREGTVFRKHVLRNSLSPVLSVTALQLGGLLGGTVIIERVFSWPGLSGLLIDGVTARDYPLVQGVVLVIAAIFILINIAVDIAYGFLDPRGRTQ